MSTEPASSSAIAEGWGLRGYKRKTHYYRDGESLCGQGRSSDGVKLFAESDPWPCKTCKHIRDAEGD